MPRCLGRKALQGEAAAVSAKIYLAQVEAEHSA